MLQQRFEGSEAEMKHPPYHLRSNKAVDRYLFVELLKKVFEDKDRISRRYTYVGFGGPFLEDLKVAENYFPEMSLVSIEQNEQTLKRQRFHRFCRRVKLLHTTDEEFVDRMKEGMLVALWFDYLGCTPRDIGVFADAVRKCADWSVLRITLQATLPADQDAQKKFITDFNQLLPGNHEEYFETQEKYWVLLQKIVHAATTPPIGSNYDFQILNSGTYKDGARMLTVTGIKCPINSWKAVKNRFSRWRFFTQNWSHIPEPINIPDLSIQERLHLASLLPTRSTDPEGLLSRRLGYSIGGTNSLKNYAAFCRYFPLFVRISI